MAAKKKGTSRKKRPSVGGGTKMFAGPLANLEALERGELSVGNAFHAFRFKEGGNVNDALKELKTLEKQEINIGASFHAFRFNASELRELTEVEKTELEVGNAFHAFRFG